MIWYVIVTMFALAISMFIYMHFRQGEHRRYDRRLFDRRVRSLHVPVERRKNMQDRRQFNRRVAV